MRRSRAARALVGALAGALGVFGVFGVLVLGGCRAPQSALAPAGPQAGRISHLWWAFLAVTGAVFVLVMAATVAAIARQRRPADLPPAAKEPATERRLSLAVGAATTATLVILFGLLGASVMTDRALASLSMENAVLIRVTGHQWWWEVEYPDEQPSRIVLTANEIHIPVGRPVLLKLSSRDVIHSFWVPSLNGKRDLIPGHEATLLLRADRPGAYPGQCAEFCGHQHANMALLVVAEPQTDYDKWLAQQRQPARVPSTAQEERGRDVFLSGPCVMCHAISGTQAGARTGPDLTHLAGRWTLASGILRRGPGGLGGWLADPQHLKPGARMPPNPLPAEDLLALVAYLESLR